MEGLGHGKLILKSDQEPAIVDLQKTTREERMKTMEEIARNARSIRGLEDEWEFPAMTLENSPVGESKSNGAVENAMEPVHGQIRTAKLLY